MMTPERWILLKELFAALLEEPTDSRPRLITELCHGDQELQAELERLIKHNDLMGGFLDGPRAPQSADDDNILKAGVIIAGRYQVVELLGRGGMGEVYEAQDQELGERTALKVILHDASVHLDLMERLRREVQLARKVTHPNVCRVFDLGHHQQAGQDLIFLSMELIKGETLTARLKREGKIGFPEAAHIARQLCQALGAAHEAGILHRDFKCGNVMLMGKGDQVRAVVTDFGIARWIQPSEEGQSFATNPGLVMGTPTYMSPEQLMGEKLTAASDIYALGLVLYEMVTGIRPFQGDSSWTESLRRLSDDPPAPVKISPGLDPRWNRTVVRCLQRSPARRFTNAQDVADSLQRRFQYSWKDLSWPARAAVLCLLAALVVAAIPSGRHGVRSLVWRLMSAGRNADVVPDNPFALRNQAQIYLERWDIPSNVDHAITLLNRALELDHDYAPAYASLTFAYFEKKRLNPDPQWTRQAEQSAAHALQLNGDLADAHLAAGVAATMGGRAGEAEKEFRKASELEPKNSKAHRWLGFLYMDAGSYQQAEDELARSLALNPKEWRAHMSLGVLYLNTTRYQEAATTWEQVSKSLPDNFVVLQNLGAVYHFMDREDDAASVFQRALEIEPDAVNYSNLGTQRYFQGRYEDAASAFEKAVQLAANNYELWGNLADAYRWAPGQRAKAKPVYETAVRLAREALAVTPQDIDIRSKLALYLVKNGDRSTALAEIQQVERAAKKSAAVLFYSAVVYEISGDRDQALAVLSTAMKAGYSLKEVRAEPELLELRSDARYQSILEGLPAK